MINVLIAQSEDGKISRLEVNGHSGYAERGKDTVCAASSILFYTVLQDIITVGGNGGLRGDPVIEVNDGCGTVECEARTASRSEISMLMTFAATGYGLLAQNYPEYVTLRTDTKFVRA